MWPWTDSPLRPLFDTTLFSCECGLKKPKPPIYRLALSRPDLMGEQASFVGDGGNREHQGVAQTGIRSLLITHFLDQAENDAQSEREKGSIGKIGFDPLLQA